MSTPDPDTIVRRFIDGDLSDDEVRAALHRIADDPEARALLQFEVQMTQDLAASGAPDPSPGFAAQTVERLREADATNTASSLQDRLRGWWATLTQPIVTVPVRPAYTLAVLALVAAVASVAWPSGSPVPVASAPERTATPTQPATTAPNAPSQRVWTRFVYTDDDADSVAVAGDFSQWQPVALSPRTVNGKTVWTGLVPVSRGEHEYQFVIDGEKWVTDPLAPVTEDDGFGAKNAVLKL